MCCVHVILRWLKRAAKSWTVFKAGALKTMTAPWRTARPKRVVLHHNQLDHVYLTKQSLESLLLCTETNAEGGIGLPHSNVVRGASARKKSHCWFLAWPVAAVAACNPIRGGPWLKQFHLANPAAATHFIQGGQEIYNPGLVTGWISSPLNLPDLVHQQRIETRLGIA